MKKFLLIAFSFIISINAQYKSVWDKVPESVRNSNSFKRYEWFYRTRLDEQGNYPKDFINDQRIKEEQKVSSLNKLNKGTASDQWTNIGPVGIDMTSSFIPYWGVNSGRIRGMEIHPTDPNIVYVGAAAGGIWKTTDGGTSWVDKSGSLNRLTFGAIAIDPGNTNIVYAGSGEGRWLYNNVTFEGDGLYKTTDGGTTWTQLTGIGTTTQFSDIEVSPHNSNIILAALGAGNWNLGAPSNTGIWRSSNGGTSWTKVIGSGQGFEVAFHPSNANLAYCGVGDQTASGGFLISTDAGITWNQSNTGLPTPTAIGRIQFDISPSSPTTLYSVIYNNSALAGGRTTAAFKSTDGGANWAQISSGTNIAGSYDGAAVNDQGSYDLCITVNPTDPSNVFFGNVEISKTTDGSSISFVRNPAGYNGGVGAWACYTHVDVHKIIFAPSNSSVIYVGCDGGVYKSTNGGSSFSNVNNDINTIQFYRVASHPTNSSILYGGAQDNGNFSTSDKGATKWVFETSGDGMECFVDYNNTNNIFVSTQQGSLTRSTDAGVTWTNMVGSNGNTAWTAPFWQHPNQPAKIYAAYNSRIIRSVDTGQVWNYYSATTMPSIITSVSHSPANPNKLMLACSYYTTSPTVYKSTNEGLNWTSITSNITGAGFTGTNIQRVIADPSSENTFYITRASYTTGQVIKTTDFGTTWTNISGDLPSVSTNDLFIDPANTNHYYAANDFGVYWSSNSGTNWTKLSNGMPFVPVMDFDFFNSGGFRYLRAASHGRGVFELNIDVPLPIQLSAFTVENKEDKIMLNWTTSSEINNAGFEIERSVDQKNFTKIGFVKGNGNSNTIHNYRFVDEYANGFLTYRLKQLDNDGSYSYSPSVNIQAVAINDFAVYQNYPNPFNPVTLIKYKVPAESRVQIQITNALGEKIETLINNLQQAGIHEVVWDGSKHASGIYFYTVTMNAVNNNSDGFVKTYKMILTK